MPLIIAGHERSGTTLLRNLCNEHPDMAVTMEFANFHGLGRKKTGYIRRLIQHWRRNRHRSFLIQGPEETKIINVIKSHLFVIRYLFFIYAQKRSYADISVLDDILRRIFPKVRVVGDKMPNYIWELNQFAAIPNLHRFVMYRDCRDVTNSIMRMVRTKWSNQPFIDQFDSIETVAQRWCLSIELMESNSKNTCSVKYEELISNPGPILETISEELSIDPAGFPIDMIRPPKSNSNYFSSLTKSDLNTILRIAGPTMERLGYI